MILKEISKIGATRCQILRQNAPKSILGSLQCSPDPLAVFKGPTSKGKEGEGEERREKERGGEGKGEEGRTTLHTPCRKFLATPLMDWIRLCLLGCISCNLVGGLLTAYICV